MRDHRLLWRVCLVACVLGGAVNGCGLFDSDQETRYADRIWLPSGYNRDYNYQWPLILFLHGGGGPFDVPPVESYARRTPGFGFIVSSPESDGTWAKGPLDAHLKHIQDVYRIDPDRIYVTGLSRGGTATWGMAIDYPYRFAAIAPVCGASSPEYACEISHLPVWIFHNRRDPVMPFEWSEWMAQALEACGGNVRTTFPDVASHDAWTEAYNNPELYSWFLSYTRTEEP